MKQLAYPAALGCGCFVGTLPLRAVAAEWTLTPVYSSQVEYDSNRRLELTEKGSEDAVLTADLRFKWAIEDGDIFLEPRYSFRRYSDPTLGDGDDRSVFTGLDRFGDDFVLNLTASYWDQSTLLTELLETGIVSGNTHRRLAQAGSNWTWQLAERRQLISQFSYQDVSYHGEDSALLPGYKYPSGAIGERYSFSERGSVSLSAFGSVLSSSTRGNSSHEYGLQAEVIYAFSEETKIDASVGESERVLTGSKSQGTDASVSLTHMLSLGNLNFSYTRSLIPYGTGFLVQREQYAATLVHPLTFDLDGTISLLRIQNNQTTVELGLDRRSYSSATLGLDWHPAETWAVGAQVEGLRTQLPGLEGETVNEWRTSVSLTWYPHPKSHSG
jgi:hypothetical protein